MEALLSGQGGLAAIVGRRTQLRFVDGSSRDGGPLPAVLRAADQFSDLVSRDVRNVKEADREAEIAWQGDRALRLALLIISPDGLEIEYAIPLLDDLLKDERVYNSVEARLFAQSLPVDIVSSIETLTVGENLTARLLRRVLKAQDTVSAARQTFDSISDEYFEGADDRKIWLFNLVSQGSLRDLSDALAGTQSIDFVALQLASRHRQLPNAHDIVRALTKQFRTSSKIDRPVVSVRETNFSADSADQNVPRRPNSGRKAYESAINQQSGIIDRVRIGDHNTARAYTDELVANQLLSSSREQVAKSLCRLSKSAKDLEVYDLQLEWSQRATEICPQDPLTFGHLADAYITSGRYVEADQALNETERLGNALYAANGRARILRNIGKPQEARQLFLAAVKDFPGHDGVEYSLIGAAECLRDLGRSAEALREYEKLVDEWPLEPTFRNGLASTLVDLGRLGEAVRTYGQSVSANRESSVAFNGRANVSKVSGQLSEAESLYREARTLFPTSISSMCGLADVLRLQGKLSEATELFQLAMSSGSFNVIPVIGISDVLRDQGNLVEALKWVEENTARFKHERSIHLTRAYLLRQLGRFNQAMAIYDQIAQRFPYFLSARVYRADLLRYTGHLDSALREYRAVLKDRPRFGSAETGLIATLIALGQLDAAERLIGELLPRTQSEWNKYLFKAIIVSERGGQKSAIRMLEKGVQRSPFARIRKLMRNTAAGIHISRKDYNSAYKAAIEMPGEPANIVYIHALAASRRTDLARKAIEESNKRMQPSRVHYLVGHVGKYFGISSMNDNLTRNELIKSEFEAILLAA